MLLTVCSCHVTYRFQRQSTLYSWLNVKEILPHSRHEIWSLSDCNCTRTQNHLARKRTHNHLAKLAKWLSCVLRIYLYGAFDCMFLSCHVRVSEWIHNLELGKCQGTSCSNQERNQKFMWIQLDWNSKSLSWKTNARPFGQTGQMIELCSEYLFPWYVWLYVLVMWRTRSRVSLHSIVLWMSRNSLLEAGPKSEV